MKDTFPLRPRLFEALKSYSRRDFVADLGAGGTAVVLANWLHVRGLDWRDRDLAPLTLLVATMTFWLAKVGIDTATIGFAVALGIPYTIKFLWAPLVDKLHLPFLTKAFGQRRSWLFFVQALLFFSIWQLGASNPQPGNMTLFAIWALITAFLSATQDIVIDA